MSRDNNIRAGDITGAVVSAGDGNQGQIHASTARCAPSRDPVADIAELRKLLLALKGVDAAKIEAALAPAEEAAGEPAPDKGYIAAALERAVSLAKGASDFADAAAKITAKIEALAGWLGEKGGALLRLVGGR